MIPDVLKYTTRPVKLLFSVLAVISCQYGTTYITEALFFALCHRILHFESNFSLSYFLKFWSSIHLLIV